MWLVFMESQLSRSSESVCTSDFPFPSATVTVADIPEIISRSWNENGDDKDDLKWTYSMNKKWFVLGH